VETVERTIIYFEDDHGKEPVRVYLNRLLKKRKKVEVTKINARIKRAGEGNFGDHRFLSGNLLELKIDIGPGYRIYCGIDGDKLIVLVNGGTKKTQEEDIRQAKQNWDAYLESKN